MHKFSTLADVCSMHCHWYFEKNETPREDCVAQTYEHAIFVLSHCASCAVACVGYIGAPRHGIKTSSIMSIAWQAFAVEHDEVSIIGR